MSIKLKGIRLNEEITIPPELANSYLSVKKMILDKQTKKDRLMKQVNQVDNEVNILTKNLIAIETKAATMQGETEQSQENKEKTTVEVEGQVAESLDEQWMKYINEGDTQDLDDFMNHTGDWAENKDSDLFSEDIEAEDEEEILFDNPDAGDQGESLEGDYVFTIRIEDKDEEEDIIAKFYKDEDDDFWKVRVVQGSEEPLETMQFDPDMEMLEIIEHLATMFDEVEEMDTQEYADLLDDKDIIDNAYYDDIIKEE